MIVLTKAAQLLLSLSILVIVHEFGHFIFAKLFKCRVEKFFLFFDIGFSLFKTKKGETEYGIGWLPLGGYVKIAGMIDESMDKEQLKQPPQPYEFRSKPAWQRLLIMIGGVVMNFIIALIIYIGVLYAWGEQYLPTSSLKYGITVNEAGRQVGFMPGDKIVSVDNVVIEDFSGVLSAIILNPAKTVQVEREGAKVDVEIDMDDIALMMKNQGAIGIRYPFDIEVIDYLKDSPAKIAGIKKGDKIVKVNGQEFEFQDQYTDLMKVSAGKELLFTIQRDTQMIDMPIKLTEDGLIGIQMRNKMTGEFEFKTLNYGFWESIPAGIEKGWNKSVEYLKQFKLIFNKKTKGYESVGSFLTIGSIFPGVWNWHAFWDLTAFLSIILGVMNLLPIPALDGGHVMFVLYEIITGRKPSEKFLEYAQYVGFGLLILIMAYAFKNDIVRFLIK